ncbi:serine acetyltransferase [Rufibacter tibetensis]|uniref:Serine acetyltransferase n=1 Tax=Rufibacter tibetensis TaxID=512763 RepID=A0A0P0CBE2_9BACT|nr:serine acetyltransferase [Rufibacter tibetensis]ALJ00978.1 hypothetical protein DC20_20770 [Rufibacter tibetensis]
MSFRQYITQDFTANKDNTKGKVLTLLFRVAGYVSQRKKTKLLFFPYLILYRVFVEWMMGFELPWTTRVGPGLRVYHGQSTVINKATVIGRNCTIRHSTTIGNSKAEGASPVIGNNVEIGSNVCIIGNINIGDNVVIGAGSIVVKSLPSNSVVVGNPAKVLRIVEALIEEEVFS